jgi:hypothetical protein
MGKVVASKSDTVYLEATEKEVGILIEALDRMKYLTMSMDKHLKVSTMAENLRTTKSLMERRRIRRGGNG